MHGVSQATRPPHARPIMLHLGRTADVATSPQRMRAFEQLGFAVTPLDLSFYVETGGRIVNHLRLKLAIGPGIAALNRRFVELAEQIHPHIVWVDKGLYLWPRSLRRVKQSTGALLVHLDPDDPFGNPLGRRLFFKAIPEYDVHVVAREVNIPEFKSAGAKCVVRYHWAYDPNVHRPIAVTSEIRQKLGGPVGFIGDWEAQREAAIRFLAESGVPVRIWGPRWERKVRRSHPNMRIEGACLIGDDYARAICAFDINLGFLRKINRDLSTTRSVEIPACGGFLLAERTSEHQALFEEGKEAEFFDSPAELLDKTRRYLADTPARVAIAQAGRQRCQTSGYSHVDRQRAVLREIERQLHQTLLPTPTS